VTLVHGRLSVAAPLGVDKVEVSSAAEMLRECKRLSAAHPILIMAAAVADYRALKVSSRKIESGRDRFSLELVPTPDLLAELAPRRAGKRTVGFALETTGSRERAREKMRRKKCDLMVMNNPMRPGSEFGGETNEVVFLYPDGREEAMPVLQKLDVAREIIRRTMEITPRPTKRDPARRGSTRRNLAQRSPTRRGPAERNPAKRKGRK
jgi:phosphopantothenoylcysteine decarboxylase/phosphopantothenate--cysteine ligase